mmetsp:Transcript_2630/g.4049  ORF Transcript_2630/g.4049 Transcript_2630/m.4049 type:complete len:98 (-) Transcript_2630:101-394(-)
MVFPSSHRSVPPTRPSPHLEQQLRLLTILHVYPVSILHAEEQPSKFARFPSSHVSGDSTLAFPHTAAPETLNAQTTPIKATHSARREVIELGELDNR